MPFTCVDMDDMTDATTGRPESPTGAAGLANIANAAFAAALAATFAAFVVSVTDVDRTYPTRSYRGVEAEDVLTLMVLSIVVFACMVWFLRAMRFTSAPALTATALGTASPLWYWSDPADYESSTGTGLVVWLTAGAATLLVAVLVSVLRHLPVRFAPDPSRARFSVAPFNPRQSDALTVDNPSALSRAALYRWAASSVLATAIAVACTVVVMQDLNSRWWGPVTRAAMDGMRERVQPDMVFMMTMAACLGIVTAVALTLAFAIRLPRHPASIIATAVALAVAWAMLHSAADDRSLTQMGFCLEGTNGHVHPDDPISMCM